MVGQTDGRNMAEVDCLSIGVVGRGRERERERERVAMGGVEVVAIC